MLIHLAISIYTLFIAIYTIAYIVANVVKNTEENSYYSFEEINHCINAFLQVWSNTHPNSLKLVQKRIHSLKLNWTTTKPTYNGQNVLAIMNSLDSIDIWIGPTLPDGTRRLEYTGLIDQLTRLAFVVSNQAFNEEDIGKIVKDVQQKLY